MLKPLIAFLMIVAAPVVMAADDARQQKVAGIAEAAGLQAMFEQVAQQEGVELKATAKQVLDQVFAMKPDMSSERKQQLIKLFDRVVQQYAQRPSKDYVDLWTKFYGTDLSDDELDQILAFYKSPIGQKDVAAAKAAQVQFTTSLIAERKQRLDAEMDALIEEVKKELSNP